MDALDESITILTKLYIKQYEEDKDKGTSMIYISKKDLIKKTLEVLKEIKKFD